MNLKQPKFTSACNSNIQPFAAAIPACADISLQLPSPGVPLPAGPLPAANFAPTVDYPSLEVCTQLGSSSFVFGVAPVLQSGPKHVQASSPNAVGGPTSLIRSPVSVQSLCTVAPNSVSAPFATAAPSACASPLTPAASSSQSLPYSASSLASATARPPGSPSACALPSPVPACSALPVSALFVHSGPSKRRLLFVPGPKLAKRLKLG